MAVLSEQVYMLIRNQLLTAGITAYSDIVPTETAYPFCMYEILDTTDTPTWAFEKDYETITVRFNFFDNASNPLNLVAMAEQVETIFNRTKLVFVESEGGIKTICNYKINDSINYIETDKYWLAIGDYEFVAERNVNEDADSSSSD